MQLHNLFESNKPSVIYQLSRENPMDDTEVLVLGGAGRYTLAQLRERARRMADQLRRDMDADHGDVFRSASRNVQTLANTLNTITAAYDELNQLRSKGGISSRGIRQEDLDLVENCQQVLALAEGAGDVVRSDDKPRIVPPETDGSSPHPYQGRLVGEDEPTPFNQDRGDRAGEHKTMSNKSKPCMCSEGNQWHVKDHSGRTVYSSAIKEDAQVYLGQNYMNLRGSAQPVAETHIDQNPRSFIIYDKSSKKILQIDVMPRDLPLAVQYAQNSGYDAGYIRQKPVHFKGEYLDEESNDRNERLRAALAKIKQDFEAPPTGHAPSKPVDAPAPKPARVGGGMPYYPDSNGGRRYMGDSLNNDYMDDNLYDLYDDHPQFRFAHYDIDQAVKNAHVDPAAVVKAMRKHRQVGATDSASRDTIYYRIKRLHGATVANATRVLDESEQIDEISTSTADRYLKRAMGDFTHQDMGTRGAHPEDRAEHARKKELRRRGISRAVDRLKQPEQVDEVSAKTLTSYIDKASHDHSKHRGKNILRARRKLLKKPLPPLHPDHHKNVNQDVAEGATQDLSKISTEKLQALWDKHKDEAGISPVFGQQLRAVAQELARRKKKGVAEGAASSPFTAEDLSAINQYLDDDLSFHELKTYPGLVMKIVKHFGLDSIRDFRTEMEFYDRLVQAQDEGEIPNRVSEISKSTAVSYNNKAAYDITDRQFNNRDGQNARKVPNREKGMALAVKKLGWGNAKVPATEADNTKPKSPKDNFTAADIKELESLVRDLPALKARAIDLVQNSGPRSMKPEKIVWFTNAIERMDSPLKVIKLMYDLLLAGEGFSTIGTKHSMKANSYRDRFSNR